MKSSQIVFLKQQLFDGTKLVENWELHLSELTRSIELMKQANSLLTDVIKDNPKEKAATTLLIPIGLLRAQAIDNLTLGGPVDGI